MFGPPHCSTPPLDILSSYILCLSSYSYISHPLPPTPFGSSPSLSFNIIYSVTISNGRPGSIPFKCPPLKQVCHSLSLSLHLYLLSSFCFLILYVLCLFVETLKKASIIHYNHNQEDFLINPTCYSLTMEVRYFQFSLFFLSKILATPIELLCFGSQFNGLINCISMFLTKWAIFVLETQGELITIRARELEKLHKLLGYRHQLQSIQCSLCNPNLLSL